MTEDNNPRKGAKHGQELTILLAALKGIGRGKEKTRLGLEVVAW